MASPFTRFKSHRTCIGFNGKETIHFAPSTTDTATSNPRRSCRIGILYRFLIGFSILLAGTRAHNRVVDSSANDELSGGDHVLVILFSPCLSTSFHVVGKRWTSFLSLWLLRFFLLCTRCELEF